MVLGLLSGIFVARVFGVEAKGVLAGLVALVGLGSALSSLGVSYSAVKLGGDNTNSLFIIFSFLASLVGFIGLILYDIVSPHQVDILNYTVEIWLVLFLTIYNLQSLAFILSRPSSISLVTIAF